MGWVSVFLLLIGASSPLGGKDRDNLMEKFQWQRAASLPNSAKDVPSIGVAGPASGVHREVLFVAGGANFPNGMPWEGGLKQFHSAGFVYARNGSKGLQFLQSFSLAFPVAYPASVSTPQGVVMAGGENEAGPIPKVQLLSWDPGTKRVALQALPDLPIPLSGAAACAVGDLVYLSGGTLPDGTTSDGFFVLQVSKPGKGWKRLANLPEPLAHAVLLKQSNGVHDALYLIGGRRSQPSGISVLSAHVYVFDLKKETWKQEANDLPYPLSAASGVSVGSSYLLVFSGDSGEVFSRSEALLAAIRAEPNPEKQLALKEERTELLKNHPGFRREVLLYNTITKVWAVADSIPFPAPVTTQAVRWGDMVYLTSGEIRAGVRTPDILEARVLPHKAFQLLDYTILVGYLLLMIFVGWWSSSNQSGTDDFFKGGQRIPGWAAGLSIYGTQLSAITFMSIPAKTYTTNWNYFFLQMTIILAMPVIVRYFIPFFRRLNITSAYEYLEKRFSYAVRALASLLFIFLQVGRLAIVLLLPSMALTLVTGIDVMVCILMMGVVTILYTMYGGIEAVIWTDVVQVVILLGGAFLTIVLILFQLDLSPGAVWQLVSEENKIQLFNLNLSFSEPTLWVVLIGGMAINIVSYGTDQAVVQRYLTTKDEQSARRSLRLGAWMALPSALLFFSIGTLLFLFYRQFPAKVDIGQTSADAIYPWYIVSQMPSGVTGFLISAIFAAAMSTLSSSLNSVSAAFTVDFYRRFRPTGSESLYLQLARIITLVVGVFGTVLALVMSKWGISSLWDQFNTILGLFTGGIGGLFILGIFFDKVHAKGALAGVLLSALIQFGISQYTSINLLLYAFTGLLSCVLFGWLFSLILRGKTKDLRGLTYSTLYSETATNSPG